MNDNEKKNSPRPLKGAEGQGERADEMSKEAAVRRVYWECPECGGPLGRCRGFCEMCKKCMSKIRGDMSDAELLRRLELGGHHE